MIEPRLHLRRQIECRIGANLRIEFAKLAKKAKESGKQVKITYGEALENNRYVVVNLEITDKDFPA